MTAAAVAFCCLVVLALVEGFGAPAFTTIVASDAMSATLPFVGILLVSRFAMRRFPARAALVARLYVVVQAVAAAVSFGWWWVEPHAVLTSWTVSSLEAMAWQAIVGAFAGVVLALVAERTRNPGVFREVWLGAAVLFLLGGGRVYRAYDHVEAGVRLETAAAIAATVLVLATLSYLLLRSRERFATAIPALAPGIALLALVAARSNGGPDALSSRESILLVVVDTLRADIADQGMAGAPVEIGTPAAKGLPGAPPDKSNAATPPDRSSGGATAAMPELARIAKDGVRFTQAVSPAPWTLPATVSLLSGWNPHRHRHGQSVSFWEVTPGDPAAMYLADSMRDAGYVTSAFVNNPYLRPYFGFGEGLYSMRPYHGRAPDGMALALSWIGDHSAEASFTLLHLMDPHWPYDAPAGYGDAPMWCPSCTSIMAAQYGSPSPPEKDELRRRYTAEVRFTDAMLGRLYDALAAGGTLDRTWLIVTADHGEEFWEHGGFLHGHSLYDELLRVPLVVVPPKSRTEIARDRRIDVQVRLEDVAATMLDIAGIDVAKARDGASLLPLLAGNKDARPRTEIAGYVKSVDDLSVAVRSWPWKTVLSLTKGSSLFRLDTDQGERTNLLQGPNRTPATPEARKAFDLLRGAPIWLGIDTRRSVARRAGGQPDADTARNLRSLGYAN